MAANDAGAVRCLSCGKKYRWQQQHAGERLKCKACGGEIIMPYLPPDPPRETLPTSGLPPVAGRAPGNAPPAPEENAALEPPAEEDDEPEPRGSNSSSQVRSIPSAAGHPGDDDSTIASSDSNDYELDVADDDPVVLAARGDTDGAPGRCANCGSTLKPGAVICLNCGFNSKEGRKVTTTVGGPAVEPMEAAALAVSPESRQLIDRLSKVPDDVHTYEQDDSFTEYIAPLIMIGVGLAFILLDSFLVFDANRHAGTFNTNVSPRIVVLIKHSIEVVVQVPFLFGGIYVIGMLFGTSFASFWSAVLKFLGVAIFLTGFGGMLDSIMDRVTEGSAMAGFMVTNSVNFAAFWGICSWLFELDAVEVMILYAVSIFVPAFIVLYVFMVIFL